LEVKRPPFFLPLGFAFLGTGTVLMILSAIYYALFGIRSLFGIPSGSFFLGGLVLIVGGFALLWFGVEPD
jgi:hypothetical protein